MPEDKDPKGGARPGWTVRGGELVEPTGYRKSADEIVVQHEAERATAEQIDEAVRQLQEMKHALGTTRFLDLVLARRIDRVLQVLAVDQDDVAERDLLDRIVVDEADKLATARRRGEPLTAAAVADEVIRKCAAAPRVIVPFGEKLPKARAELVAALEASSVRGRGRGGSKGAAKDARLALLCRMGLGAGDLDTLKKARRRAKK